MNPREYLESEVDERRKRIEKGEGSAYDIQYCDGIDAVLIRGARDIEALLRKQRIGPHPDHAFDAGVWDARDLLDGKKTIDGLDKLPNFPI